MLRFAGLALSHVSDTSQYKDLRRLYNEYARGLLDDNLKTVTSIIKTIDQLHQHVLFSVNIIFTTLSQITLSFFYNHINPDIVIVDEAAKSIEPELWFIMAHFNSRAYVLVGDVIQSHPNLLFKSQINFLLLHLVLAGADMCTLQIQYRMHPFISKLISDVFYNDQLRDLVLIQQSTPITLSLQQFNSCEFDIHNTSVMINLSHDVLTVLTPSKSHFNMHNIVYVCDLLIRLHTDADITIKNLLILTPYQAQYLAYKTALIELQNLFEAQYGKVLLRKVSSFQDEHHSVMIVDLVITKFIDFLRDYNRLNLALFRARYD
ncbi:hypothetical protein ACJ72_08484 [Emergomyces africanus]|uniref:DNA2/NAM7 helicase-like C-terminal domain-containing protein n=1 Tax=Emergomyces africanus TaxID=1955775 RepID=A0A1B7NKS9_9EURO|nr:hypothetical protein ACJ72_08484 [Emergomyces africanus]